MKQLAILGSTGSIGVSTLDVVAAHPERFKVVALAAGGNVERLEEQARRFAPRTVVVRDEARAGELQRRLGAGCRVLHGEDGLLAAATDDEADLVVGGIVGAAGVRPVYAAVDAGRDVALANKESLVVAGAPILARAAETGARLLPVDSEHNALHQCLRGESAGEVARLWLTASGGPFRERPLDSFDAVTPEEALAHPTWRMGRKISIDSATMMNKGLEVIEARWLFDVPEERIRVVVHPQSTIHSMVELIDGSFKAQLGVTDMRHPIQYALTWPERWQSPLAAWDPVAGGPLTFEEPDPRRFPCLELARAALREGGAAAAVLNAANEVAVEAFLDGRIRFPAIARSLAAALERQGGRRGATLMELLDADRATRESAQDWLQAQ